MTRKKGKQPKNKVYDSSKGQRLSYQGEISKSFSQWDVIVPKRSKRSNVMTEKNGVKCKAPSYVIKSCGRSYMHTSIIELGHMI